jgi:radical SAM superfamily enzyme YgiQ (UPF0313 family)
MASVLKRKAKDLKIIVGGPHATMLGQQILEQYESIDIAVKFEAELTINEIVKCLFGNTSLDHIPNLIVRKEKGLLETSTASKMIDVDILKPLDYSIYFSFDNMPQALPIEVGRGCPFVCSFCSTSEFFKRKYRLRGVDFLIKELKSLKETYGISSFDLNHDLFGLNKTYLKNFCNAVRSLEIEWTCSMRPDLLDPEIIKDLASSNCKAVYFGMESGSPRIQELILKKLPLAKCIDNIKEITGRNIQAITSFIIGFPFETAEDLSLTLDVIGRLLIDNFPQIRPQLHLLSPEPGTPLYREYKDSIRFEGYGPELFEECDVESIRAYQEIYSVYYSFPTILQTFQLRVASHFINYELSRIGYPFFIFLLRNYFNSSLSEFYQSLLRFINPDLDFLAITKVFDDGYLQLGSILKDTLISDIFYFIKMTTRLPRVSFPIKRELINEEQVDEIVKKGILLKYPYNFLEVIQQIQGDPFVQVSSLSVEEGDFTYAFFITQQGNVEALSLNAVNV